MTDDRWIPVSERLPELEQEILVIAEGGTFVARYSDYMPGYPWVMKLPLMTHFAHVAVVNVTHWMPLPEGPE